MTDRDALAGHFKADRERLRAVAYRLLGSASEAEDALQEAWLRLSAADTGAISNPGGWLTTVVARIALDMLRARKARREAPLVQEEADQLPDPSRYADPEQEALLAESVGIALMVVLDRLAPAERLAFVLHDLFGIPFADVAAIVGRSAEAARQLASRARRRVRGGDVNRAVNDDRRREIVTAFAAAARKGDFDALLTLLAPNIVLKIDRTLSLPGVSDEVRGAAAVATRARLAAVPGACLMLVDGVPGIVVAPSGRPDRVLAFTIAGERIVGIEVVVDAARLARIKFDVLDD